MVGSAHRLRSRTAPVAFLLALLAPTGCATTYLVPPDNPALTSSIAPENETPRIVLMPIDVELYELTMAGISEPKADWTREARTHLASALARDLSRRHAALVRYFEPEDRTTQHLHSQLIKLHEVVADAIMTHAYADTLEPLPAKKHFDWTMSSAVELLQRDQRADYALFVHIRDSYESGAHLAMTIAVAILSQGQYLPPGARQVGVASLVDLRTGRIVWVNRLGRSQGDLRESESALETVEALLAGFPG